MSAVAEGQPETRRENRKLFFRALAAVVLIVAGLLMALPRPFHERNYVIDAGGCRLTTTLIEPKESPARGTVLLLHGLAANRKIMMYLANGYAAMGLRVFVPDLPGHGKTDGEFSPARAEECSENLLRELRSRGLAPPDKTILAGHSMGGAIAMRVGARVPVAGVIAISPAPMRAEHGAMSETLLYENPPPLPPFTEVMNGSLEFAAMRDNAKDLLQPGRDVSSHYDVVPGATHTSLLSDARVVRLSQEWANKALHLSGNAAPMPARWSLIGALCGLAGLFLLSGPFLREATGKAFRGKAEYPAETTQAVVWWQASAELFLMGAAAVELLHYWTPPNLFRLFEGDYLIVFLTFVGLLLVAAHRKDAAESLKLRPLTMLGALLAAVMLLLLFTAWFELSLTEAWLDATRWQRFPPIFLGVLPFLLGEELLLGPVTRGDAAEAVQPRVAWQRLLRGLLYRFLLWLPLLGGALLLHSGEILMVLLLPFFAIFCVAQRWGMDVVREVTASAAAAALFGAILLAGFFLVIFPLH